MTFTQAALIVLGLAVVFLGLLAYNLLLRLDGMEKAVLGGMTPPSHQLSREEFGRRFAVAEARADLAAEVGTGTVILVEASAPLTGELLAVLRNMAQPRGFVVAVANGSVDVPDGVRLLEDFGARFAALGVSATPFIIVVDDGTIVGSRPVGSVAAARSFLLEVA